MHQKGCWILNASLPPTRQPRRRHAGQCCCDRQQKNQVHASRHLNYANRWHLPHSSTQSSHCRYRFRCSSSASLCCVVADDTSIVFTRISADCRLGTRRERAHNTISGGVFVCFFLNAVCRSVILHRGRGYYSAGAIMTGHKCRGLNNPIIFGRVAFTHPVAFLHSSTHTHT